MFLRIKKISVEQILFALWNTISVLFVTLSSPGTYTAFNLMNS